MNRRRYRPVALDRGGATWAGWTFAPYGRATDWRLIAPDGTHYTAGDLAELKALQLDVDYLRLRVRELETTAQGVRLSPGEASAVSAALSVLEKYAHYLNQPRTASTASYTLVPKLQEPSPHPIRLLDAL